VGRRRFPCTGIIHPGVAAKFLLDRRPRDGDIHSIQVSDGAGHEHPENQEPADFTANDVHGETQVNDCKSTRKFCVWQMIPDLRVFGTPVERWLMISAHRSGCSTASCGTPASRRRWIPTAQHLRRPSAEPIARVADLVLPPAIKRQLKDRAKDFPWRIWGHKQPRSSDLGIGDYAGSPSNP